jgi:hypothetical protein
MSLLRRKTNASMKKVVAAKADAKRPVKIIETPQLRIKVYLTQLRRQHNGHILRIHEKAQPKLGS